MKRILPLLILAGLVCVSALVAVQTVMAQDAITKLAPEAFGKLTRPAAVFVHDKHSSRTLALPRDTQARLGVPIAVAREPPSVSRRRTTGTDEFRRRIGR